MVIGYLHRSKRNNYPALSISDPVFQGAFVGSIGCKPVALGRDQTKEIIMCYSGTCKYEYPSGKCGLPRGRKCPDGMSEEELDEEQDNWEYAQEQKVEEKREQMFGI